MGRRLEGDMGNGHSTMCVPETAVRGGGGGERKNDGRMDLISHLS